MKFLLLTTMLLLHSLLSGQESLPEKSMDAFRTQNEVKVDGVLDEADWSKAQLVNGFTQRDPDPLAPATFDTEVKILFNDEAVYVGAFLEDYKDSISTQFTERDDLNNADWFGMIFCPYRDGINGVGFIVTTQGVQLDTKYSAVGEDIGWDAVWAAEATIVEDGWVVEMMIPYSALRFPDTEEQIWDINFVRTMQRNGENTWWYPIDRTIGGFLNQTGQLKGIKNIQSPVRLAATPFIAGYAENYNPNAENSDPIRGTFFNAGMDIKYGLSDAFTLDMTLIPDFGEARSDNQVLNLSPFEVRFDENRQFFTEGTELFNKGNLFYSRRAGGSPLHSPYSFIEPGETVIENPSTTQLYNATKISGRTSKGTGLGFFNAVSGQTEATVENLLGGTRKVQTSPLTNYNVSVVDQNLKNNSYVTLINTNVLRAGDDYDANVSAFVFELKNKEQSWMVAGSTKLSQQYFSSPERFQNHVNNLTFVFDEDKDDLISKEDRQTLLGHAYDIGVHKISGNLSVGTSYQVESNTFDINDLGFLRAPNESQWSMYVRYNHYKPFGKFNGMGGGMRMSHSTLQQPNLFAEAGGNTWVWFQTKNFWYAETWFYTQPVMEKDFFEARTAGKFVLKPTFGNWGFNLNTDNRKRVVFYLEGFFGDSWNYYDANWYGVDLNVAFRFSDRWNFNLGFFKNKENGDMGYVTSVNNGTDQDVILGYRDVNTFVSNINSIYSFNKNMSLNFRLRHYWSSVSYLDYFVLQDDGYRGDTDYNEFNDLSFNSFNIDMIYRWRFAPGSDIFCIWKNSIQGADFDPSVIQYSYREGVDRLSNFPESNSVSLKLVYYLDYAIIAPKIRNI